MRSRRTCRSIDMAKNDACGAPATREVEWPDGQKTPACESCALLAVEIGRQHNSIVQNRPLK